MNGERVAHTSYGSSLELSIDISYHVKERIIRMGHLPLGQ